MDGTEHAMAGLAAVEKSMTTAQAEPKKTWPRAVLDDWADKWSEALPDDCWREMQAIIKTARAWR